MSLKKKVRKVALPQHIAFIIDGNGRWATKRGLPRSAGHKKGMDTLVKTVKECFDLGIKVVSIFGFSTENWNRPKEEIDYLFGLFRNLVTQDMSTQFGQDVKLTIMGNYHAFPSDLVEAIDKTLKETQDNDKFILNLGINYGGQDEIIRAINNILLEKRTKITKADFEKYLYTAKLPSLDYVVRTSGETRLSNFMLWQMAYSELYFPETYWPAFNKK